ncbi:GNAT family N-acetyltransferase [Lutimonas sp.]|uniref:GNAT family N-acetyltransferase n=1 Tax=Lutimonas sp. TaxID=1872403 RepID=UPI003D9ACCA5
MKHLRIHDISNNYFAEAWTLYENAFPEEERRSIDSQVKLFTNTNFHVDVIVEKDLFIGLFFWWEFDDVRFVEHFAIAEGARNKGFGKLILEQFIDKSQKPIILEVELPNSDLEQRRIRFYQKTGFHLNSHEYKIPPMEEGGESLQLLIMSYPDPISKSDVDDFTKQYHPILFEA